MQNTEQTSVECIADGCSTDVAASNNPEEDENAVDTPPTPCTRSTGRTNGPRPSKRIARSEDAALQHDVLLSVQQHFKRPAAQEDRFDVYGRNVGMKLRDLPKEQRLLAERIINDTLFVAEMGKLDLTHKLISDQVINRPIYTPTPPQMYHQYQPQTYTYNPTPRPTIPNPSPSPTQHYYETSYPYHSPPPQHLIPENSEARF